MNSEAGNSSSSSEMEEIEETPGQRERRIEHFEVNSRKKNVILKGLLMKDHDDLYEVAWRFFQDILGIHQIPIASARRIRYQNGELLLVTCRFQEDKKLIIRRSSVLKGTPFSLFKDLPPKMRRRRTMLRRLRAEMMKRDPRIICHIRSDVLWYRNRAYVWDMYTGLRLKDVDRPVQWLAGVELKSIVKKLLADV